MQATKENDTRCWRAKESPNTADALYGAIKWKTLVFLQQVTCFGPSQSPHFSSRTPKRESGTRQPEFTRMTGTSLARRSLQGRLPILYNFLVRCPNHRRRDMSDKEVFCIQRHSCFLMRLQFSIFVVHFWEGSSSFFNSSRASEPEFRTE